MTLRNIIRKLSTPTTLKIIALLVIVVIFFVSPTFAQVATTQSGNGLENINEGLNSLLKICSRGWVILAILAGKLMTNDRVYASVIHMDVYLWKIWNIMKNFANFGLVAIVLFNILKNLTGKDKMDIKDIITKTLFAGILIQASWFIMGALVDVSTIATAAVGSFPSSFLHGNAELESHIKEQITKTPKRYELDVMGGTGNKMVAIDTGVQDTTNWDEILPTYNSVSGPLIYLGFSVFKFQNYMSVGDLAGAETLTISFLLRVLIIVAYTIGLALLFLANIIRVAFLWIFIIASPLIILSMLFFKDKGLGGEKSGGGIGKYLSFNVMINLIFKPVIFVAGFSMILIFVVSIQKIMQTQLPQEINGVTISIQSGSSILEVGDISSIKVKENSIRGKDPFDTTGSTIKEAGQTVFANLILFFLITFLMWQFIKIAATSGAGPVSDVMKKATGFVEDMVKTLPILPFASGASINAATAFSDKNKTKMLNGAGLSKKGEFGSYNADTNQFETQSEKFKDRVKGGLPDWKDADYTELEGYANKGDATNFFTESTTKAKERSGGLSISGRWLDSLKVLLSKKQQAGFEGTWGPDDTDGSQFFNNQKNLTRLYDLLGGNDATGRSYTKAGPTKWTELKSLTFHKAK